MIWISSGTPGKCLDVTFCIFTYSRALVMPWNLSLFPAPLRSRWDPQHVGIKSPAWPPCQHQRGFVIPRVEGRSWNHWKLAAFAINTPVATGASCQGSGRVCHGPAQHTPLRCCCPSWMAHSKSSWQGDKTSKRRDVAGGRNHPGVQSPVPTLLWW